MKPVKLKKVVDTCNLSCFLLDISLSPQFAIPLNCTLGALLSSFFFGKIPQLFCIRKPGQPGRPGCPGRPWFGFHWCRRGNAKQHLDDHWQLGGSDDWCCRCPGGHTGQLNPLLSSRHSRFSYSVVLVGEIVVVVDADMMWGVVYRSTTPQVDLNLLQNLILSLIDLFFDLLSLANKYFN